jgi:hypothetical protein
MRVPCGQLSPASKRTTTGGLGQGESCGLIWAGLGRVHAVCVCTSTGQLLGGQAFRPAAGACNLTEQQKHVLSSTKVINQCCFAGTSGPTGISCDVCAEVAQGLCDVLAAVVAVCRASSGGTSLVSAGLLTLCDCCWSVSAACSGMVGGI